MISGSRKVLIPSWFPAQGMTVHDNRNGAVVVWMHHSADPAKDDAWAERASQSFPGGRRGAHWRAEMDGDFAARLGGLVFPQFSRTTHVIPPFRPEDWQWKCRVIDPGYNHPSAVVWIALDADGGPIVYRVYKEAGKTVPRLCATIKALSGKENYAYTLIDRAAFAKTQAGGGQDLASQFTAEGVVVNPADKPDKLTQIAALARLLDLQDNGQPLLRIGEDCEDLIEELLAYRWKDSKHDDLPNTEHPVKEFDDCADALMYFAVTVPLSSVANSMRRRDPLEQWYHGNDLRRVIADRRRLHSAVVRKNGGPEAEP